MDKSKQSWKEFFCDIKKNWWVYFLGVFILWIVLWFLFNILRYPSQEVSEAINSLFSGLAFVGIIITVMLQSRELELQRKDLELTRKEIRGQKEELEAQNRTLAQQRFETSFFNLLSQHNNLISKFSWARYGAPDFTGKAVFIHLVSSFSTQWANNITPAIDEQSKISKINIVYNGVYFSYSSYLGIYFRSLYRIFVFLETSDNSNFYADIIRSQLTDDELYMLYFNGLSDKGKKFKKFMLEYNLLDNLSDHKIRELGLGIELYDYKSENADN